MLAAFWAYEGWNTIGFLGGEIHNPNKNVPLALFGGMTVIIVAYLMVNFTYLYVLPIDNMLAGYQSQNEIAGVTVIRHFAGNAGAFDSFRADPDYHLRLHKQYDNHASPHLSGHGKGQTFF